MLHFAYNFFHHSLHMTPTLSLTKTRFFHDNVGEEWTVPVSFWVVFVFLLLKRPRRHWKIVRAAPLTFSNLQTWKPVPAAPVANPAGSSSVSSHHLKTSNFTSLWPVTGPATGKQSPAACQIAHPDNAESDGSTISQMRHPVPSLGLQKKTDYSSRKLPNSAPVGQPSFFISTTKQTLTSKTVFTNSNVLISENSIHPQLCHKRLQSQVTTKRRVRAGLSNSQRPYTLFYLRCKVVCMKFRARFLLLPPPLLPSVAWAW